MRVIAADDSAIIRNIVKDFFDDDKEIDIIETARNGQQAVEMTKELLPDAVILDISMPVMDGLEAAKIISAEYKIPVLIFSSEVNEESALNAYQAGAVELLKKPSMTTMQSKEFSQHFRSLLLGLVKNRKAKEQPTASSAIDVNELGAVSRTNAVSLVVIGASTGGPKAVKEVLSGLPADFKVPIALVQHLGEGFGPGYASWLQESTKLNILLLDEGMSPVKAEAGSVYIAPPDYHIVLDGNNIVINQGEKVGNQRPAVDVLFKSAAKYYQNSLLGILLTGMGRDGADGCVDILKNGGHTIVQDRESSAIFGMPAAAIEQNGAGAVMPLDKIAGEILRHVRA